MEQISRPMLRLVLTRHPAQAGDLEAAARQVGYDVGFMPLTYQQLPEDPRDLTAAIEQLQRGDFHWLLLTSPNTVRALSLCGWQGRLPDATRLAVVGPGTARVLKEHTGLRPHWMAQNHSAAGILAELEGPAAGERMLLPQSAQARSELAAGLRARGWEVTHVAAYRSVARDFSTPQPAAPHLLHADAAEDAHEADLLEPADLHAEDVVLVTSSTAAEAYAQLPGLATPIPAAQPVLLAIGRPTAETLTAQGFTGATVLPEPTAAGLTSVLNRLSSR